MDEESTTCFICCDTLAYPIELPQCQPGAHAMCRNCFFYDFSRRSVAFQYTNGHITHSVCPACKKTHPIAEWEKFVDGPDGNGAPVSKIFEERLTRTEEDRKVYEKRCEEHDLDRRSFQQLSDIFRTAGDKMCKECKTTFNKEFRGYVTASACSFLCSQCRAYAMSTLALRLQDPGIPRLLQELAKVVQSGRPKSHASMVREARAADSQVVIDEVMREDDEAFARRLQEEEYGNHGSLAIPDEWHNRPIERVNEPAAPPVTPEHGPTVATQLPPSQPLDNSNNGELTRADRRELDRQRVERRRNMVDRMRNRNRTTRMATQARDETGWRWHNVPYPNAQQHRPASASMPTPSASGRGRPARGRGRGKGKGKGRGKGKGKGRGHRFPQPEHGYPSAALNLAMNPEFNASIDRALANGGVPSLEDRASHLQMAFQEIAKLNPGIQPLVDNMMRNGISTEHIEMPAHIQEMYGDMAPPAGPPIHLLSGRVIQRPTKDHIRFLPTFNLENPPPMPNPTPQEEAILAYRMQHVSDVFKNNCQHGDRYIFQMLADENHSIDARFRLIETGWWFFYKHSKGHLRALEDYYDAYN